MMTNIDCDDNSNYDNDNNNIDSLRPSDAYIRHMLSMAQIMACRPRRQATIC